MRRALLLALLFLAAPLAHGGVGDGEVEKKHHRHRHHHRHKHGKHHHKHHHRHHHLHAGEQKHAANASFSNASKAAAQAAHADSKSPAVTLTKKATPIKPVNGTMVSKATLRPGAAGAQGPKPAGQGPVRAGKLEVNAPLPEDFARRFAAGAAEAVGCDPAVVKFLKSTLHPGGQVAQILFEAPEKVVKDLQEQAGDPDSKLAVGPLCAFLVARDDSGSLNGQCGVTGLTSMGRSQDGQEMQLKPEKAEKSAKEEEEKEEEEKKDKVKERRDDAVITSGNGGIDVDTAMPYGDLEPFGREDTAQELTESSIKESDEMVDQLEKAEVAEEKRAVFRALTRLRGAAIASFDGIARSQTGNIDEFSRTHSWRESHPLHHLAMEESDISKWAFPDVNL